MIIINSKNFILKNKKDSRVLAKFIASSIKKNDIVTFEGDLGIGKTFLCKEIINFLCHEDLNNIISPTFSLVQFYYTPKFLIYHFDLYRLKYESELYELGIEEAFNGVCLIEWPKLIEHILPYPIIKVKLSFIDRYTRHCIISYLI